jgi:hypothetical protein
MTAMLLFLRPVAVLLASVVIVGCESAAGPAPVGLVATSAGSDAGDTCVCATVPDLTIAVPDGYQGTAVSGSPCAANLDPTGTMVTVRASSGSTANCGLQLSAIGANGPEVLSASVSYHYVGRHCGWLMTGATGFDSTSGIPDSCPSGQDIQLALPDGTSSEAVDVVGDFCSAPPIDNQIWISGADAVAPSCSLVISLADGSALATTVKFRWLGKFCGWTATPEMSPWQSVPNGAPACSR